ncbi:PorV/PorQ family protein [candidate division KSB1 bacterium]|nr:PorV/PorQ family protein [candidate division KSB1 bacterium]
MKNLTIKTFIFSTFLMLLWHSFPCAQDFEKTGTTGFVFLELPATARLQGMGETGMTLPDAGADGLFVNPALTALQQQRLALSVSRANWYVETSHQAFGLTYAVPVIGTIGVQAVYFDFGEIEKTKNPGSDQTGSYIDLGTYTAGAYAVGLSFGRSLTDKFSFGASLKYVRESIDIYHADNVITDIGFLYQTGFHSLRIGTFLQNFGLESNYSQEKFKMPQILRMGLSGELVGSFDDPTRLTLVAEASHPSDANERIHLGMESIISNTLIVRAGYKFGYDEESLCLGGGLRFDLRGTAFGFDMAYMNHERLDATVRYTLVMEF